jgi:GAF domain-containing protein
MTTNARAVSLAKQVHDAERALDAIHEIARAVLVLHDLPSLCRTIFQSLRSVVVVDAGFINRYNQATDTMQALFRFDEGFEEILLEPWDYRDSLPSSWIVKHHQPIVFDDYQTDLTARFPSARQQSFGDEQKLSRAWMSVPLLIEDRLAGIINVQSYQAGIYGASELFLLQVIANPLAVALENARLLATLESTISTLEIPIIPLTANILVMPLIDMPDRARWDLTIEMALEALQARGASGLLLDASGIATFDPHTAQALAKLTGAIQLMGGHSVLIGMRPALIQELVHAQMDVAAIHTERDLPAGLRLLHRLLGTVNVKRKT